MVFDTLILLVGAAAAAGIGAALAFWFLRTRCFVTVPPNRALVLFGQRTDRLPSDARLRGPDVDVGRPRVVVGGGAYVAPWNRAVGRLSLDPVTTDVTVRALSALEGSRASGWEVRVQVCAQVPREPALLETAAVTLLDKTDTDVRSILRQTVEATVPSLLTRLRADSGEPDWERLGVEIQAAVAPELVAWGLVVRGLAVTQLSRIGPSEPARTTSSAAGPSPSPGAARLASLLEGFDQRVSRAERTLGILGDRLARMSPAHSAALEGPSAASIFDLSLGSELPALAAPTAAVADSDHESMGGEPSPRSRPSSPDGWTEEGGRDPRSLSD